MYPNILDLFRQGKSVGKPSWKIARHSVFQSSVRKTFTLGLETVFVSDERYGHDLAFRIRVRISALCHHGIFLIHWFRLSRFLVTYPVARLEADEDKFDYIIRLRKLSKCVLSRFGRKNLESRFQGNQLFFWLMYVIYWGIFQSLWSTWHCKHKSLKINCTCWKFNWIHWHVLKIRNDSINHMKHVLVDVTAIKVNFELLGSDLRVLFIATSASLRGAQRPSRAEHDQRQSLQPKVKKSSPKSVFEKVTSSMYDVRQQPQLQNVSRTRSVWLTSEVWS